MATVPIANSESTIRTRIPERWHKPVLVIWACLALASVGAFVSTIIAAIQDPGFMSGSLTYGPIPEGYKWAYWFYAGVVFASYTITGFLILWRQPKDWLAITLSLMLIGMGSINWQETEALLVSIYRWAKLPMIGMNGVISIATIIVLFHFPDGKRYPRWSHTLIVVYSIIDLRMAYLFLTSETRSLAFVPYLAAVFLGLNAVGLGSQIIRYRKISSATQRQQTKWVVFGFSGPMLSILVWSQISLFQTFGNLPDIVLVANEIVQALLSMAFPLSVLISIQRYRLWDIDFIINRSIVYGLLTILLGGLIGGSLLAVSSLFGAASGGQSTLIALTVSALIFGLLFNPLRKRLRQFVDRRLYGIEVDYYQAGKTIDIPSGGASSFADYHDLTLIGQGGMGMVYKAHDSELGQLVALKVLPGHLQDQEEYSKRFTREAETISDLTHSNIVKLYRVGSNDGAPFMVMEYIDGHDLSQKLKEAGKLALTDVIPILNGIAAALDYAHEKGIVHRDIKPSNIMVDGDGRPVLMDFGIARIADALTKLTGSGGMVGTLDYISPEQVQGTSNVDRRADIYSLGVMAYQLLTGSLPFRKANPGALVLAHLMEPPPDACLSNVNLPLAVCAALQKAMAKSPNDRFDSAGAFVAALT